MVAFCGVDIAKRDFTWAVQPDGKDLHQGGAKLSNDSEGWKRLSDHLQTLPTETVCLGVESTGGYERPLVRWFRENTSVQITVLNPIQVKRFGQSRLLRTKTDRVDAELITHYMATHQPEPSPEPSKAKEELKRLSRHLDHLKKKRADEKTYRESVPSDVVAASTDRVIKCLDEQIAEIEQRIRDHIEQNPDLKDNIDLLQTIPGIGEATAALLLSEMNPSMEPKQQVAHAGLAPRANQSGTLNGKARLCRTGNKRLRSSLYFPTLAAIRHNPIIQTFYEKLISKGKPKMVAVCACMRKLLHIIVGVLKNKIPFDPKFEQKRLAN